MSVVPEEEARLDAVFKATVDGIILIDADGRIDGINPAAERMFGYAAAEVMGSNVKMLMPAQYSEAHDGYLRRHQETGETRIIGSGRDVIGRRKNGTTFPMHLSVAEVLHDGKRTYAGVLRDITDAKAAQRAREQLIAELERKNTELERFTHTVSHDLKSPLITIKSFAGQLEQSVANGSMERFRQDVGRISAAADKMATLLDDLLALSRAGRVSNPTQDVPLGELVAETLELLSATIGDSLAEIVVAPGLPTVRGDRTRLREVVQNLIENSLKFSAARPHIEFTATVAGPRVVCCIRDQGIGIAAEAIDRIFDLFEQLDSDRQGTGVGLALVQRIVDVHGGRVWAESEGLGLGTAIFFELPLAGGLEPGATTELP